MGKRNASPYPWAFWRRLAVVQDHGPRPRYSAIPCRVEAVTQEEARRLYEASGSVDGLQVALREISGRVRAQRDAMQTFEVPA